MTGVIMEDLLVGWVAVSVDCIVLNILNCSVAPLLILLL